MFVVFFVPSVDNHGSPVIYRSVSVRPKHFFDPIFDHDYYFKLLSQESGEPIHLQGVLVHEISGFELSPCAASISASPRAEDGHGPAEHGQGMFMAQWEERQKMRKPKADAIDR